MECIMEQISPQELNVKLVPPRVKLHWPTWYCPACLCEEIEVVAKEMYMCISCKHVDSGRTVWLDTIITTAPYA